MTFAGSGGSAGGFATVVTAQCAPGRIADAMAWGVDILNHASKVTGLDSSLVRGLYGPWATLAWISLAETWDEVDAASAALPRTAPTSRGSTKAACCSSPGAPASGSSAASGDALHLTTSQRAVPLDDLLS